LVVAFTASVWEKTDDLAVKSERTRIGYEIKNLFIIQNHITMTIQIWRLLDLHRSRNWPRLHNVSTSDYIVKGSVTEKLLARTVEAESTVKLITSK
jgi:hypothetical protein